MNKLSVGLLLVFGAIVLQGCVAIPPLIQVQHRDSGNNLSDSRLDAIEKRLERIEQKIGTEAK
jgi:hypothetical protein